MPRHFSIGEFARLTGLTPRALRIYARVGLLKPEAVNPKTGYRYYSQAQAQVAERIRLLRSIDMPLEDIRSILVKRDSKTKQGLLVQHREHIEAQIACYQEALQTIEEMSIRDIDAYPIAIKNVPAQPVVFVRQQTSVAQIEVARERAFGELYGFLKQKNIAPLGPGFSANANEGRFEPDQELNIEDDWLIDVCVPVASQIENRRIQSRIFAAGRVAYVVHTGPYQPLFQVYKKIAGWIKKQDLTHTGQTREIYHLSLAQTRQRNNLKTEVQFFVG